VAAELRVIFQHLASPNLGRNDDAVAVEVTRLAHELFVWVAMPVQARGPMEFAPLIENVRSEKRGSWEAIDGAGQVA
jgi:hypothetical protein